MHASLAILIIGVTIFSKNISWLIAVILLELCILGLWHLLDNKCILTLVEERLTGEHIVNESNHSQMTWINRKLGEIVGFESIEAINTMHPYLVISILCVKILMIHTVAAPPM